MGDLKMLASGFLRLTEGLASKLDEPVIELQGLSPALPATAAPAPSANLLPGRLTYDASNTAVNPPVEIDRSMPTWKRAQSLRNFAFQGMLDIVVGEQGDVIAATMLKPVHTSYDGVLLAASKRWRFHPATIAGRAVPYRLTYPIIVEPAGH
jgi:hypothetical protein